MDNPYKIKPGEKLTLSNVLDRYLDWSRWNSDNNRYACLSCDRKLWSMHLCCENHMAISAESNVFLRYMYHLSGNDAVRDGRGFSMNSMRKLILEHRLGVPSSKVARFFATTEQEWMTFLLEDPNST